MTTNKTHNSDAGQEHISSKLPTLRDMFLSTLRELGTATANEVARKINPSSPARFQSIRRRASDLEKDGVIEVIGDRVCATTGVNASEYRSILQTTQAP